MKIISLLVSFLFSSLAFSQTLQPWMSSELSNAWAAGYKGAGVNVIVVDDFKSRDYFSGKLSNATQRLRHGEWTLLEASLLAPAATFQNKDFGSTNTKVSLVRGLNVINLSYGMYAPPSNLAMRWGAQESSIIGYAVNGQALISKAAGNDSVVIGAVNSQGNIDYLNKSLRGAQSAIYVGALDANGSIASPARIASYSNRAGNDLVVQNQFLVVGVLGGQTSLHGTSFAAPIISGYAAILGSKFKTATPTQITNQLLNTARQDTVFGYSPSIHGRGEASLTRALSPVSIR
jgi:subtilisin family serine protease